MFVFMCMYSSVYMDAHNLVIMSSNQALAVRGKVCTNLQMVIGFSGSGCFPPTIMLAALIFISEISMRVEYNTNQI